jgi:hypothetical protein
MKAGIGWGMGVAILHRVCRAWWRLGFSVFRYVCRPKENLTAAYVARPRWPKGRRRSAAESLAEAESCSEEIDRPMYPMTVAENLCGRARMSNLSFKVDVEFP